MDIDPEKPSAPPPSPPAPSTPPTPPASPTPSDRPSPPFSWPKATMWIVITAMFLFSALYIFKQIRDFPSQTLERAARAIDTAGTTLVDVASAFNQGTITTSFVSFATTVHPTQFFQFATLRQMEVFTHTEEARTAFGYVRLPDVVVEARAPVEYTYYLDLSAKWEFFLRTNIIYVKAPPIKFNEPAFNVSLGTFEVKKGGFFRDDDEARENLKQTLTYLTHRKARENIGLVRETGRKQAEEFIAKWVARSFADGDEFVVKVFFPDEEIPEFALASGQRVID